MIALSALLNTFLHNKHGLQSCERERESSDFRVNKLNCKMTISQQQPQSNLVIPWKLKVFAFVFIRLRKKNISIWINFKVDFISLHGNSLFLFSAIKFILLFSLTRIHIYTFKLCKMTLKMLAAFFTFTSSPQFDYILLVFSFYFDSFPCKAS